MIRRDAPMDGNGRPVRDDGSGRELLGQVRVEEVPVDDAVLELVVLPADDADGTQDGEGHEAAALAWVAACRADMPPVQVPLYGTTVIWSPSRAAILAPHAALVAVREALLDFARCDAALRRLEGEAGVLLGRLDEDAPCAVEFDERHIDRQASLEERFRRSVRLRADLATLAPAVLRPPVHPPTLAAQLGERLRERTRLADRLEFVQAKADVLDRVYDLCAQRVGDFAIARRHLRLEWVIIVLLAAELVVLLVEVLAGLGTTPTP